MPMVWNRICAGHYMSAAHDYCVRVHRLTASECKRRGYPQSPSGWSMEFDRGGCHASAFHESAAEAQGNASRIIGYMRGTCDVFGNIRNER
jgi:hypothetical protein